MDKFSNNRNQKFAIVYFKIKSKHPNWSHGRIKYCTRYAIRNKGRKINGKD